MILIRSDIFKSDNPSFSFDVRYVDVVYYPQINKKSFCKAVMTEKDAILITGVSADAFFSHYAALRYLDKPMTSLFKVKN